MQPLKSQPRRRYPVPETCLSKYNRRWSRDIPGTCHAKLSWRWSRGAVNLKVGSRLRSREVISVTVHFLAGIRSVKFSGLIFTYINGPTFSEI